MWVVQKDDEQLPSWVKAIFPDKCSCGGDIENYYNDRGAVTSTRCSNKDCPLVRGQKIKFMLHDMLKVDGVGDATGLKLATREDVRNHFDVIPIVFPDKKPEITLSSLLRLCFVEGIDTGWTFANEKYVDVSDLLRNYDGKYKEELLKREELLRRGEEVFRVLAKNELCNNVKKVFSCTVMLSGNIRGFRDRNDFIKALNLAYGGVVDIRISESKRKTGIYALVQEEDTPNRGKAVCALENGIPIVTPKELANRINEVLRTFEEVKRK